MDGITYKYINDESWKNISDILLFGFGRQGKKAVETLMQDFNIVGIIDNDPSKEGVVYEGIPIMSLEHAGDYYRKYKIIVTASERYYSEISLELREIGLVENVDFVMYQFFIVEWYLKYKDKIYIPKTDIPITSFCTLNCEKCHIFIPHWKKKFHYDLDKIMRTIDEYFIYVDYVFDVDVLGGEPLIYPWLDEVLDYIGRKYRKNIGYMGITTNGTVSPKSSTINLMKKYDIHVSISDYSGVIKGKSRVEDVCKMLEEEGVGYLKNSNIQWFDFGMPNDTPQYDGDLAKKHFQKCNTIYRVIYNHRFYCCGTAWAAGMSGLYKSDDHGSLSLVGDDFDEIRKKIFGYCRGDVKNGFLDFCRICGGFGDDNTALVETAKQMEV